ncbi:MAG: MBL fold metallo-hydrolase [Deltaproteobacteria bacterium]|nr:MBL fold metallo-hydrolase [Deltaproteobacteria bacterium]MBI3079692.1 MBL fold metallo-hydrolase [Deltaproteobacteria bacterium]
MEAKVTEIGPDIFRISIYPPGYPVNFGCFLIRDENPTMVETGFRGMFDLVYGAVRRLIEPARLRYLVIPHFEMDECGSLNQFLAIAPRAEPVCSPLGGIVTVRDFSERPPRVVGNGEKLPLGRKELRFVLTPWVHFWDSMLVYDETDRTLFTSDLFMQPGDHEPMTGEDRAAEIIEFCRFSGLLPSQKHLEAALARIEPLAVDTLACHHGSVLNGDPRRYYRALRENAVGDVVEAPFYEMKMPPNAAY